MTRTLRTKLRRDVRRQRGAFAAITLTIFLGVTLFGATYDAFLNLKSSYDRAFSEYRFADLTVSGGDATALARLARRTPGVEAVQARTQVDLPIRVGPDKFLGRVVGVPAGRPAAVNRLAPRQGAHLAPGGGAAVLVEKHMAETFHLAPGDRVTVVGVEGPRRLRVAGVVSSPEYFWPSRSRQEVFSAPKDFGVVFAAEPLARALAGRRSPNQVAIYYRGGRPDGALTGRLGAAAERLGAADVMTRAQQPSNSALQQDVTEFEQLAVLFPLLFLTAAALATGVLMRRLVASQRPIIGMLRACGFGRRQLVAHYLSFGLATGLLGAVLGAVAGFELGRLWTGLYTDQLSIPLAVVEVRPLTIAAGLAFGVLVGGLAAAAPAALAASVPPAEAMRRFAPARRGGLSLAERLAPPLRRLPVRWRMALRSIGRNPRRALSTVTGVVLALILILSFWVMIDSATLLIHRQYHDIERQDAQLVFRGPVSAGELDRIRRVPGVARVEPAAEIPVSLQANGRRYQTALIALRRDTRMHGFYLQGGGQTELPATGLLAGSFVRSRLDLESGQSLTVGEPQTGARLRAPVTGFLDEPVGSYVYASLEAVRALAGGRLGAGNSAFVSYAPGADPERMRRALSAAPGVAAFVDSQALLEYVNGYLGLYYLMIGLMVLFGGAMAFALLYNVIQSNLAERAVEVATLRAAGMPFGALARMITVENVVVASLGIVPGCLIAFELARLFMGQFSTDWFNFAVEARPSTFILSSLAILAVALLSELPGLRAVKRLDVAAVVRERSA
jgi:putative ABC transport system permease protein